MFVEYLSERQQSVLLHYAYEMMRADKRIEAEEKVLVEALRRQTRPGVEAEDVGSCELDILFEDRLTRIAFLIELVGMGYVDGQLSGTESKLIHDIATALHIGRDDMASVDSWVRRQFALLGEARELMEG